MIQASGNSGLDFDGDHGDGEKWKDQKNVQVLGFNQILSDGSGEGGFDDSWVSGISCQVDGGPFYRPNRKTQRRRKNKSGDEGEMVSKVLDLLRFKS